MVQEPVTRVVGSSDELPNGTRRIVLARQQRHVVRPAVELYTAEETEHPLELGEVTPAATITNDVTALTGEPFYPVLPGFVVADVDVQVGFAQQDADQPLEQRDVGVAGDDECGPARRMRSGRVRRVQDPRFLSAA